MKNINSSWPIEAKHLAKDLHALLSLNDKNWHALKGNPDRRAAELLSGALVHLLNYGTHSDVIAQIDQSLLWLQGELKDPGCPRH